MKNRKMILTKPINMVLVGMISMGVMGSYMTMPSYATSINKNSQETKVVGTFEPTILDVRVPATTTFIYNPNTSAMISQNIEFDNQTNAPVYIKMKEINVSEESTWKPSLVAPGKHSPESWNNLTKVQSEADIALGLIALESDEWLYEVDTVPIWSVDDGENTKVGTIKNHGFVEAKPTLRAGNSLPTEKVLTTNYIFEFGLEEGIVEDDDSKDFTVDINNDVKVNSDGSFTFGNSAWFYRGDRKQVLTNEGEFFVGGKGINGSYSHPLNDTTATFELDVKALKNDGSYGFNSMMLIRTGDTGLSLSFHPGRIDIHDDIFSKALLTHSLSGNEYHTYRIVKEDSKGTLYIDGQFIGTFSLRSGSGFGQHIFSFGDGTSSGGDLADTYYKNIRIAPGKALYIK